MSAKQWQIEHLREMIYHYRYEVFCDDKESQLIVDARVSQLKKELDELLK